MAAQAFTNLAGNPGSNQPTSYVASDGFVGKLASPLNPNSPTFGSATFPSGMTIPSGTTIPAGLSFPASSTFHGAVVQATLALPVTAAATTDFTMSLPAGATVLAAQVYTTTAYGAVTDAKISIGVSAGDATYVAQTSVKAAAVVALAFAAGATAAANLLALPTAPNLYVRITQTGGNSATGAATMVVTYIVS